MALVSARKNRLGRALAQKNRLARASAPKWTSLIDFFLFLSSMILMIYLLVVLPVQLFYEGISIGLTQGPDAFLWWYASEYFNESSIELVFLFTGIALVICLIWSLYVVIPFIRLKLYKHLQFRRHARDYSHARDYRRELPSAEFHPVVVSRYLNGQQLPDDIFIALLHLAALNVVRITGNLDESSPDYYLPSIEKAFFIHTKPTTATQSETENALISKIDRAAFRMLCSLADTNGVLTLEQLIKAIEQDFFQRNSPLSNFSRSVSRELDKANLVRRGDATCKKDDSADHFNKWLEGVAKAGLPWFIVLVICDLLNMGLLPVFWSAIPPVTLVLLLWSLYAFGRRVVLTDDGYRVLDECRACKRWMEDFTALRQAQAGATLTWNDYLTYAYVLEVNETLVADMWQAGGAVIEDVRASFIAKNGRPHFWWSRSKRLAYKRKWNIVLEEL